MVWAVRNRVKNKDSKMLSERRKLSNCSNQISKKLSAIIDAAITQRNF